MENFLTEVCRQTLKPLDEESLQRLLPLLKDFRRALPEPEKITFFGFLAATYGLAIHYCSEHFAARLLLALTLLP